MLVVPGGPELGQLGCVVFLELGELSSRESIRWIP